MSNDTMSTEVVSNNNLTKDELATFRNILGIPERNAFLEVITQFSEVMKASLKAYNSISEDIQDMKFTQLQHTEAINKLAESNKAVADSNTGIAKAIYVNAAKTEKAFSIVARPTDINGLFYSTYSEENKNMWIQMIKGDVCSKCLESNSSDTGEFFSTLYSDVKKFDHYDVDSLLVEYKKIDPTADILKMCANSDALRLSVEKRINNIQYRNFVRRTKAKSPKVGYLEANRCPSDIKALICKIAGTSHPAGTQYNKILKHILKATNMDKADIILRTKDEFNIGSCNVWFAVSKFPSLVNALQELATAK